MNSRSRTLVVVSLTLACLLPGMVMASGSTRSVGEPSFSPHLVTQTLRCVITEIHRDGTILMKPVEGDRITMARVHHKTKIRARNKNDFEGRKKLELSDLKPGQTVKVTTAAADGELLSVQVLKAEPVMKEG